jgi:PilZ domain-containing protein
MGLDHMVEVPMIGLRYERRRSSRYRCGGSAYVLRIPILGTPVRGALSDVSLHGCCIRTDFPMTLGLPIDIRLQVNAVSFRANGTVKVIHGVRRIGIEFSQMTSGGRSRLEELIADFQRLSSLGSRPRVGKLPSRRRLWHLVSPERIQPAVIEQNTQAPAAAQLLLPAPPKQSSVAAAPFHVDFLI